MPPDGRVHSPRVLPQVSHHDAVVDASQGVVLQLRRQSLVGKIVLRRDDQPGGVPVDAVNDAGPQLPVNAGQVVPQGVEQAVDQGVGMPRRRMND